MTMTTLPVSQPRDAGEIPVIEKRPPGRPKGSRNQNAVRDAERQEKRQLAEMKRERRLVQEQKRAPQAQVDTKLTLGVLGGLGVVMFIATAVLTADGTIGSAVLARFVAPWMSFVLFGAIEVAVLVFLLVYYVKGSRENLDGTPEKAGQWFFAMLFASAVAVGLSAYHVLDLYEFDWASSDMYVGIGIRLVVALFFVMVSKALASVLFAKPVRL